MFDVFSRDVPVTGYLGDLDTLEDVVPASYLKKPYGSLPFFITAPPNKITDVLLPGTPSGRLVELPATFGVLKLN